MRNPKGPALTLGAGVPEITFKPNFFDRNDLKAQENWKNAVNQAMREAQAEWQAAIGASSDGAQRPWIPLLLHGAKRPGFLSDRLAIEVGDQPVWDKIVDQLVPLLENHTVGRDEAGYQAARAEMELRLNDFERFLTAMDQEDRPLQCTLTDRGSNTSRPNHKP
jgi:hypothetical protein